MAGTRRRLTGEVVRILRRLKREAKLPYQRKFERAMIFDVALPQLQISIRGRRSTRLNCKRTVMSHTAA